MAENPRLNEVRLDADGILEFFDGTAWVPYPDVPDDNLPPIAVTREDKSQ